MNYLTIKDPLSNDIYFDKNTIGLAILNSELSSFIHNILRKTVNNPTAILEVDKDNRIYVTMSVDGYIRIVNVIYNGTFWYAKDVDLETKKEDLILLLNNNKTIYKK